eukprot:6196135-Pleurochrysis_carterae.AAC.6
MSMKVVTTHEPLRLSIKFDRLKVSSTLVKGFGEGPVGPSRTTFYDPPLRRQHPIQCESLCCGCAGHGYTTAAI